MNHQRTIMMNILFGFGVSLSFGLYLVKLVYYVTFVHVQENMQQPSQENSARTQF